MTKSVTPFRCLLIGLDDNPRRAFDPEVSEVIATHRVFSGGLRHLELVRDRLPSGFEWIPITVPLADVFRKYRSVGGEEVVIFASGDPLFNGFGGTILREMPEAEMKVYPYFNSLQTLAHRLLLPYGDLHTVSLTGRPWLRLDEALIEGRELIGVLTDKAHHTPGTIAQRMLEYGYDNYEMSVGELLGNPSGERVRTMTIAEAAGSEFRYPNNLILRKTAHRERPFGIPEGDFSLLDGRANMITKMPVRLVTLHALDLGGKGTLWDVGFCTGSVSIEAKLRYPHLEVVSFEKRAEGEGLMRANSRKFGAPGIRTIMGDFLDADLSDLPKPDAVFLGGYGGRMDEVVARIASLLTPRGTLVFNGVSEESRRNFVETSEACGLRVTFRTMLTVDDHNPIEVIKAERE